MSILKQKHGSISEGDYLTMSYKVQKVQQVSTLDYCHAELYWLLYRNTTNHVNNMRVVPLTDQFH